MHHPAARHVLLAVALLSALAACKPGRAPDAASQPAPEAAPAAAMASGAAAPPAAAAVAPAASPRDTVIASMQKMVAARSYHADMHFEGGRMGARDNALDFVAPDRFRMTMAGMGSQVIIGRTMYMDLHGRRIQVPAPAETMQQWRDPIRLQASEATMTVDDLGGDVLDGTPAHKYMVHQSQPRPVDMSLWIDSAGRPLQVATHTAMGDVTTRYSRFDDPTLVVQAPR